jgi:hypothetical protein
MPELTITISDKTMDYLQRSFVKSPEAMASEILKERAERLGAHPIEKPSFLGGPEN